jgi:hypothetical protein
MPADTAVQRQIDYLGDELAKLESRVIDPIEYGELRGKVAGALDAIVEIRNRQKATDEKLDQVLDKLSEAKGGWRLLMGLGGAAATLGGIITWFATHTVTVGPKP